MHVINSKDPLPSGNAVQPGQSEAESFGVAQIVLEKFTFDPDDTGYWWRQDTHDYFGRKGMKSAHNTGSQYVGFGDNFHSNRGTN
jgi:hypothetical protein